MAGRSSPLNQMAQWFAVVVRGHTDHAVKFQSCPVCGCALVSQDTQGMARHVLWHHNRGEWPWEKM